MFKDAVRVSIRCVLVCVLAAKLHPTALSNPVGTRSVFAALPPSSRLRDYDATSRRGKPARSLKSLCECPSANAGVLAPV